MIFRHSFFLRSLSLKLVGVCGIGFLVQSATAQIQEHQAFPQAEINAALKYRPVPVAPENTTPVNNRAGAWQAIRQYAQGGFQAPADAGMANDTLFVGLTPADTVIIDTVYNLNGPVFVFNDGVLIFQKANATISGDINVFQNGTLLVDSSTLYFPQQYFYQRALVVAQQGRAWIRGSTLNYNGLSHNLVVADSGFFVMEDVVNNDWTTAGAWGSAVIDINGTTLGGEYILSGNAQVSFRHTPTLLLWHHFPDSAVVDFSFPDGDSLYAYQFDNNLPGVSGIGYHVDADSCTDVWWGIMPVNGSDVTISNSKLRTIGAWFERGDSASVSGLINNSSYVNFTAPLTDRNLELVNTDVQTWSLYVFDSSHIDVSSCIVGEIGTLGRATAFTQSFLLDGSGGYFWASDTSVTIASGVSVTSNIRSERNGVFLFGYGTVANGIASATGQSVMVTVQSTLPQDPVPYDGAVAWNARIAQPQSGLTNDVIPVTGSAWLEQGPQGSWMDFGSYSLGYRATGTGPWTLIVTDSLAEVYQGVLGNWNTTGLSPGGYELQLVVKNDLGDSVNAIVTVTLLPGQVSVEMPGRASPVLLYPNPATGLVTLRCGECFEGGLWKLDLFDLAGRKVVELSFAGNPGGPPVVDVSGLKPGTYLFMVHLASGIARGILQIVRY